MSNEAFPVAYIAYGMGLAPAFRTTIVQTYGGHEQRNADWSTPLRRWRVPLSHMDDTERAALISFIEDRQGAFDNFLFTDPVSSTQYRVRFADDVMDVVTEYYEGHFGDVDIVQVRDSGA